MSATYATPLAPLDLKVPGALPHSFPGAMVATPEMGVDVLRSIMSTWDLYDDDKEHAFVLHLTAKHQLIHTTLLSVGTVSNTFMAPREMFRNALLVGAAAVVIAHTHPSGNPEPSKDDEAITRRAVKAGDTLGIDVLDHLVLSGDGADWVSMARRGLV